MSNEANMADTRSFDFYVFDLDGTLLDTLEDLYLAVNAAMRFVGAAERSKDEVRAFVGNGIKILIERALGERADERTVARALDFFKKYYGERMYDHTAPYAGVTEMLRRLRAANKRVAVVSNKADFAVKGLCEKYFGKLVNVAIGENESAGIRKKPAPDSVFTALLALGGNVRAKNESYAVYIGDSEVDIQTAKNANLPCISVCWGFKSEDFLIKNGAQRLVRAPMEIF